MSGKSVPDLAIPLALGPAPLEVRVLGRVHRMRRASCSTSAILTIIDTVPYHLRSPLRMVRGENSVILVSCKLCSSLLSRRGADSAHLVAPVVDVHVDDDVVVLRADLRGVLDDVLANAVARPVLFASLATIM